MGKNNKLISTNLEAANKLNDLSEYFGIGYKKLKAFVEVHSDERFVLWNGNRIMIKRELFEKYMNERMSVI